MHEKTPDSTPAHGNRLFNSTQAREILGGISIRTFRTLTGSGAIKTVRQGTRVYVTRAALDEYIASLPSGADASAADAQAVAA